MSWKFLQSTGELLQPNGDVLAVGYSGLGAGKDNPTEENVPDVGPIPQGQYTIGAAKFDVRLGPIALPLTPAPTNAMFGRSGFFIHGDSAAHPGQASHGCIVLDSWARKVLAWAADRTLDVVE